MVLVIVLAGHATLFLKPDHSYIGEHFPIHVVWNSLDSAQWDDTQWINWQIYGDSSHPRTLLDTCKTKVFYMWAIAIG